MNSDAALIDDPELRAIFVEELGRHLGSLADPGAGRAQWQRALHAMLGAARMMRVEGVAEATEALQGAFHRGDARAARRALGALAGALEALEIETGLVRALVPPLGDPGPITAAPPPSVAAPLGRFDAAESDEIRAFFRADARSRLETLGELLVRLAPGVDDHRTVLDAMLRELHALKGSSGTVGFAGLARAVHAFEGAAQALRARSGAPNLETVATLEGLRSRLRIALDEDDGGEAAAEAAVARLRSAGLLRERDVLSRRPTGPLPSSMPEGAGLDVGSEVLRVPAVTVARLSESLGEVAFVQRRLDARVEEVSGHARGLLGALRGLEDALRKIGPARPWGAPADALALLQRVGRTLDETARTLDGEAALMRQDAEHLSALGLSASAALKGLGRVSVGWLFDRVVPSAEAAAVASGRNVRVQRHGEAIELDRAVAEKLVEPLSQLARNAVIHGIEKHSERLLLGKSAWATLRLDATRVGDGVRIGVEDDGAGIHLEEVASRARALGLVAAGRKVSEAELLELLFLPGFSTRRVVDVEAGRGVGLDLVRETLRRLGGVVRARTRAGAGARFEVEFVPRPLAQRMLSVRVAEARWLLPLARVVGVSTVEALDEGVARIDGSRFYGAAPRSRLVVLLRDEGGEVVRWALGVDAVENPVETVVRALPSAALGPVPFGAASVDGDGTVVLVLDPDRALEYGRSLC